jgi:hypothetical protein
MAMMPQFPDASMHGPALSLRTCGVRICAHACKVQNPCRLMQLAQLLCTCGRWVGLHQHVLPVCSVCCLLVFTTVCHQALDNIDL